MFSYYGENMRPGCSLEMYFCWIARTCGGWAKVVCEKPLWTFKPYVSSFRSGGPRNLLIDTSLTPALDMNHSDVRSLEFSSFVNCRGNCIPLWRNYIIILWHVYYASVGKYRQLASKMSSPRPGFRTKLIIIRYRNLSLCSMNCTLYWYIHPLRRHRLLLLANIGIFWNDHFSLFF